MILDARFVNHTPKLSLTVSWRIVGKLAVCVNSWLIVSDVEGMCSAALSYCSFCVFRISSLEDRGSASVFSRV